MSKNNVGFTLIELLAVIVILAIIALIAVPIVINIINDAKIESQKRPPTEVNGLLCKSYCIVYAAFLLFLITRPAPARPVSMRPSR